MSDVVHCAACQAAPELRALTPGLGPHPLLRCDACLGVLVNVASLPLVATYYHQDHYVMSEGHGRHVCRHCEAVFDVWRERCRVCLKEQAVGCVRCLSPMEWVEVAGVALDVCRPCHLAWFDRGELGLLTRRHQAELNGRLALWPRPRGLGSAIGNAILQSPDTLGLAVHAAHASGHIAATAVEGISVTGAIDLAAAAGDGAAELAGGAIAAVLSLFDGL